MYLDPFPGVRTYVTSSGSDQSTRFEDFHTTSPRLPFLVTMSHEKPGALMSRSGHPQSQLYAQKLKISATFLTGSNDEPLGAFRIVREKDISNTTGSNGRIKYRLTTIGELVFSWTISN